MFLFAIVSCAKKGGRAPGVATTQRGDGRIHQKCFDNIEHYCAGGGFPPCLPCIMGFRVLRR